MDFFGRMLGFAGAAAVPAQIFDMGLKTLKISRHSLHSATRSRVVQGLKSRLGRGKQGIILLQGGTPFAVHSTDADGVFRQESYFHYLFGVTEDGFYGALDVQSGDAYLFMPRLPDSFAVWFGEMPTPASVKAKYAVQHVFYVDEMAAVLADLAPTCLHLLVGENTDSGKPTQKAHFEGISAFTLEQESLFDVITECRVFKTPEELAILQYCSDVASAAHVELLRYAKPGMMEYQLESIFLHFCYFKGGCRNSPYTPIAGSGPKAATLHYGTADAPNNRLIQDGELVLLDMGTEYYRYGSDITVTLPVSGKFTAKQRAIYEGVLSTMNTVRGKMKPGVQFGGAEDGGAAQGVAGGPAGGGCGCAVHATRARPSAGHRHPRRGRLWRGPAAPLHPPRPQEPAPRAGAGREHGDHPRAGHLLHQAAAGASAAESQDGPLLQQGACRGVLQLRRYPLGRRPCGDGKGREDAYKCTPHCSRCGGCNGRRGVAGNASKVIDCWQ